MTKQFFNLILVLTFFHFAKTSVLSQSRLEMGLKESHKNMMMLSARLSTQEVNLTIGEGDMCFNEQPMENNFTFKYFRARLPGFPKEYLYCCYDVGYQIPCTKAHKPETNSFIGFWILLVVSVVGFSLLFYKFIIIDKVKPAYVPTTYAHIPLK